MDRRFVTFLALSFAVLLLNSLWLASRQPRPEPEADRQELAESQDRLDQEELNGLNQSNDSQPSNDSRPSDDGKTESAPESQVADTDQSEDPAARSSSQQVDPDLKGDLKPTGSSSDESSSSDGALKAEVPLNYVTLGSIDPDSPYRQLVTLTSQGAAVRRIELANTRYRDLQDRTGYLGHLEIANDTAEGVRVRAVGQGTPAAAAGLLPGDRILAAGVEQTIPIQTPDDLQRALIGTKPGQSLQLQVEREDAEPFECTALLMRRPLEVVRPEAENVLLWADKLPDGYSDHPSFLLTLQQLGQEVLSSEDEQRGQEELDGVTLHRANWEILKQDETSVSFRMRLLKQKCEIIKRYQLATVPDGEESNQDYPAYSLHLEIEIHNFATQARKFAYRLQGPNGLPMEGWWYANKIGRSWGAAGIRDVLARSEGGDTVQFSPAQVIDNTEPPMEGNPLAYVGVDAQYFAVMMLPEKDALSDRWISKTETLLVGPKPTKGKAHERRYANVSCRLTSNSNLIEPGTPLRHSYLIFSGPKRTDLLAKYQASDNPKYGLNNLQYYGWFTGVAKAMLAILHFFYGIVGNYGLAIIMLTVLVRGCMFPISRKQAASMAKMQELKPEMDRIKEKYKGDMQKQSAATQDLYRKYKINPMAGCLPMLIQLPIFVGLYRSLMVDVELRQAPLLSEGIRWCSNLSAPDMFFDWSSFMPEFITSGVGIMGLGPYLNVLPLVTISLFLLQQMMFMPEAATEQAVMQQKIMKYMMVFMGFMFFKVAAGLCLYFIVSSGWGIAERKLINATKPSNTLAGNLPDSDTKMSGRKKISSAATSKNGKASGKRRSKRKR
ncbi:MAG: YidC/Oxa1 family insertase periplasmic-domain containing protein [Pirellulales bacterium]